MCAYRASHLFVPGCFTRPPGTSTRNHPHDPTTSKPVVPGGYVVFEYIGSRFMCDSLRAPPAGVHLGAPATRRPGALATRPPGLDDLLRPWAVLDRPGHPTPCRRSS